MNCDDVFDILTRGPFPSGAAGEDLVEAHLAECVDCRRLAVALRPAVELIQEAIGPEESGGLPGYRGSLGWQEADDPFEYGDVRVARWPVTLTSCVVRPRPSRANLIRFAAAVIIGVAAAVGSRSWVESPAALTDGQHSEHAGYWTSEADPSVPRDADPPVQRAMHVQWLAAQPVSANCVGSVADNSGWKAGGRQRQETLLAALDRNELSCCTDCHSMATAGLLDQGARSIVSRACQVCHN